MKRSAERHSWLYIFWLLIFLLPLFCPSQTTSAQAENDDDFIVTLALMAVADDRMDGVMDTADLSNIRDLVDEYYTQKSYLRQSETTAAALADQRSMIVNALDQKIKNQKFGGLAAAIGLFGGLIDANDEDFQKFRNITDQDSDPFDLYNSALSSGPRPNPLLLDMLQERLSKNTEDSLNRNLDGQVATTIPDGLELVVQSYTNERDYYAGLRSGAFDPDEIVLQPLIFINMGGREVRVLIEYYEPPIGLESWAPGLNLFVPGNSEVLKAGFPQGNYVFCVDWLTDYDTDGDGLRDYDKAIIHGWISSGSSTDYRLTREVYVNASYSPTPTGKCDGFKGEAPETEKWIDELLNTLKDPEKFQAAAEALAKAESMNDSANDGTTWDQGDGVDDDGQSTTPPDAGSTGTITGLTSAELANQGTHNYVMTCESEGVSSSISTSATIGFTADGVNLAGEGFFAKVGSNMYQNSYGTILTFTSGGYTVQSFFTETDSNGQTNTVDITCTAVFN